MSSSIGVALDPRFVREAGRPILLAISLFLLATSYRWTLLPNQQATGWCTFRQSRKRQASEALVPRVTCRCQQLQACIVCPRGVGTIPLDQDILTPRFALPRATTKGMNTVPTFDTFYPHMQDMVIYFPGNGVPTHSNGSIRDAPESTLPDLLRCGYTSKRCENPRTVKKSGGLHRFCAYHRERANQNQWRVDNRRRQRRRQVRLTTCKTTDCDSPRPGISETLDNGDSLDKTKPLMQSDTKGCAETESTDSNLLEMNDLNGSPNSLSQQDAEILNALLFNDEDEQHAAVTRANSIERARSTRQDDTELRTKNDPSVIANPCIATCMCSQCLAWATVYYFHDAMQQTRQARHSQYARV